jgi:hypothetical protein
MSVQPVEALDTVRDEVEDSRTANAKAVPITIAQVTDLFVGPQGLEPCPAGSKDSGDVRCANQDLRRSQVSEKRKVLSPAMGVPLPFAGDQRSNLQPSWAGSLSDQSQGEHDPIDELYNDNDRKHPAHNP